MHVRFNLWPRICQQFNCWHITDIYYRWKRIYTDDWKYP